MVNKTDYYYYSLNTVGSLRSRTSSIESLSDVGIASDASDGRQRYRLLLITQEIFLIISHKNT